MLELESLLRGQVTQARVRGISPEASGRMAEHFCQAPYGLAEGLDDRQKSF